MRRFAVVSCSLLAALTVASVASAESAHVVLRIQTQDQGGRVTTIVGRGSTESSQHRSKLNLVLSNGVNEVRYKAVLSASPKLTLFLFGASIPDLPKGVTWARSDGAAVAPLMDPSLPLLLKPGRPLGGGRYQVRIDGADAALLAPTASRDQLRRGFTGTTWLDSARHVIRFKATVPFGSSRATIDERFSGFGAPVQIALPRPETVYDPSVEMVKRLVVAALADIEAWNADHAKTTGYTGMTAANLRRIYDTNLSKQLKVVRATRNTYCIEATLNGITVKKDGPSGQIIVGRCPR
jgi:hypothetical protein